MAVSATQPAVFFDKDGTLVDDLPYNADPALVRFAPGAAACVRRLQRAGYRLFVVSNQSGVARGLFHESALAAIEDRLRAWFIESGAELTAFYYCPHAAPEDLAGAASCNCRKPQPGMLLDAAAAHGIDLARSWAVGDIMDDVEAGRRAGCHTVLRAEDAGDRARSPWPAPCFVADDLAAAADMILAEASHDGCSQSSRALEASYAAF